MNNKIGQNKFIIHTIYAINMKKFSFFLFIAFQLITLQHVFAQTTDYGMWRDHFPYLNVKALAEADDRIYAATFHSVFYFDKTDNSLNRMNKVTSEGLSDIGISDIAYSTKFKTLVVAYANTNIDLIKDGVVINLPDIKRKAIVGNKTINHILVIDKYAYLACGFGIVVVDIDKVEIKDTYYIGPSGSQINVNSIAYLEIDDSFYAATEAGVYKAPASSNLAYYVNWIKETALPQPDKYFNLVVAFDNKIYVNNSNDGWAQDIMYVKSGETWQVFRPGNQDAKTSMKVSGDRLLVSSYFILFVFKPDGSEDVVLSNYNPGTMRPYDAIIDKDKKLWVADIETGLHSINADFTAADYTFNGPSNAYVASMSISNNQLWVAPGSRTPGFGSIYRAPQFYTYTDLKWNSYDAKNTTAIKDMRDVLCVAADPKDGNHAFLGSWGYGLIEHDNGELKDIYTPANSSLQYMINTTDYVRIGGVAYDNDNNLWVTNSGAPNILSVRKNNGDWKSFNLGSVGTGVDVGNIVIDQTNQKWMQMRDNNLLVYNDNNTIDNIADDNYRKISSAPGNGALIGNNVSSMAIDRNGQLWLGTDEGVAVIYTPSAVFNGGNFDAQPVQIEENGFLYPLLSTEAVTAIAINGNNEKWLGTDKSGVFLMSADGTKELLHFTEANSPLVSNSIQSIKIADNGEVFFGTALGIVSYQDYKVAPSASLDSLLVYPNPVRPGYDGPIFFSNLVGESNVKITDVTGNLVWETENEGGQVLWDGADLKGKKVSTGVYYIFITNIDETQKRVGKVLIVR